MTDKTQSMYLSSSDGIRLYARVYGDPASTKLPIVCLPGLTRTDDFDAMAKQLIARDPARKILALDYRGRGRSQFADDAAHYSVAIEAVDVRQVLAALGITRAIFIGTSRGGLITMLLALTAPELIAAVVLNDIGPVLETSGLQRIASYVGKGSMPKTMDEALARTKEINPDFTDLDEDEWTQLARMSFRETATGAVALTYDTALVIRGENSDLLSEATVKEMVTRHPHCSSYTALNEAHAPLLGRARTIEAISLFTEGAE
jgi:pimeloyl-ACP methyl ester carboxylesterase